MDRRGFLQGILGGVTAAGVIVEASPEDVTRFGSRIGTPVTLAKPRYHSFVKPGEHLYNEHGQIVAIVQNVCLHRNQIETTTYNDDTDQFILGILDVDIRAKGVRHDDQGKPIVCSYCRALRPFNAPCRQCGAGGL